MSLRATGWSGVCALAAVVAVASVGMVAQAPVATAAVGDPNPLSVTYVARVCDDYADIMANKARNNVQESLRDLGPNSTYPAGGAVSVAAEDAGSPNCRPLTGWTFSTGLSFQGKSPATLDLSTVRSPQRTDAVTTASTPELDAAGNPTGATLAGAVTVPLNSGELTAAQRGGFWVQGGTPTAPLNGQEDELSFGALRCARDAVNGDNVESVSYPQGARHVYCYYYAVAAPPASGTITVRKEIAPTASGAGDFWFDGNISYADSNGDGIGDFDLTAANGAPGQAQFVRAADGSTWTFAERAVTGWDPTGPPVCTATNPTGPAQSVIAVDSDQSVSVTLAPDDAVVCTFTNGRDAAGAVLRKDTIGGVGTFDFELVGQTQPPAVAQVTTTTPGEPVTVIDLDQLPAETYTATEDLPAPTAAGSWELEQAACNGQVLPITPTGELRREVSFTVTGDPVDCVATNRFTPGGSITVQKTSLGGVGSFGYLITPADDATVTYSGTATTTTAGVPTAAVSDTDGSGVLASALVVAPDSAYTVTELLPAPTEAGQWQTLSADCGPGTGGFDPTTLSVSVTLSLTDPTPVCSFVNQFVPVGTLTVTKQTSADTDLRPDPAALELRCGPTTVAWQVAAGVADGAIDPQPVSADTTCQVVETSPGAASGVTVATAVTVSVDGGPPVDLALGTDFTAATGHTTAVLVVNTLTGPSDPGTPTTPPTSPPTAPPVVAAPGSPLAVTGAEVTPVAWAALGAILLGGALWLLRRWVLRHRH